jgi:hypothetical protein
MAAEAESPRLRKLMELARWHDEWSERHVEDRRFRPGEHAGPDSDYAVHHIDVDPSADAEAEFMMRAREILGLDPRTGLPVDPPQDPPQDAPNEPSHGRGADDGR